MKVPTSPVLKVIFVSIATAACSSSSILFTDLSYPPEKAAETSEFAYPATAVSGTRTRSLVLNATDDRKGEQYVGTAIGYKIYTDANVELWLRDAVASELEQMGFDVITDLPDDATPEIDYLTLSLQRLHCSLFTYCEGVVSLHAVLETNAAGTYTTDVTVEPPKRLISSYVDGGADVLAAGLQVAITQALYEFGYRPRAIEY